MKNIIKKIWEAVTLPFISVAVLVDDSMRYDISWESYWAKKNERG
jgi:hypothetical protein